MRDVMKKKLRNGEWTKQKSGVNTEEKDKLRAEGKKERKREGGKGNISSVCVCVCVCVCVYNERWRGGKWRKRGGQRRALISQPWLMESTSLHYYTHTHTHTHTPVLRVHVLGVHTQKYIYLIFALWKLHLNVRCITCSIKEPTQ